VDPIERLVPSSNGGDDLEGTSVRVRGLGPRFVSPTKQWMVGVKWKVKAGVGMRALILDNHAPSHKHPKVWQWFVQKAAWARRCYPSASTSVNRPCIYYEFREP
jgi:hypothetical protein